MGIPFPKNQFHHVGQNSRPSLTHVAAPAKADSAGAIKTAVNRYIQKSRRTENRAPGPLRAFCVKRAATTPLTESFRNAQIRNDVGKPGGGRRQGNARATLRR
jgi:hypothetical protein